MSERFVLLGLAHARSAWFGSLSQWAHSAAIPAEFVKCVSAEEVRARLASRRPFSALVADASLPDVDRDLIAAARRAGAAVLVVDDSRVARDWLALGASALLEPDFGREALLATLAEHTRPIPRDEERTPAPEPPLATWRGLVVAVTGSGGTGASTAAIAVAQALGDDVRNAGLVLLADLCLHAEQAMLHHARDVVPGVQELVEAHRAGTPAVDEVRSLAFEVSERGYHLLLGLRRGRFWAAIRPRAFEAAFDSLRRAYRVVVCDIDADVEGEDAGGSLDVEDRHQFARAAVTQADAVLVVGMPNMKGVHSLVRVVHDVLGVGVEPARIAPVVNQAPRSPRARAALAAAVHTLVAPAVGPLSLADAVFLPTRRVDDALRDGVRLPAGLGQPLVGALHKVVERVQPASKLAGPERVSPGSLGSWSEQAVGG
jgi:CO dehydrogenase nickel-insertion accessory protein CooC1